MTPDEITAIDTAHIWHPYAAPGSGNLPVVRTHGVFLELADGRTLIDAMSSWWAAAHGHGHPRLVRAAHEQIDRMSHVMFGGLTHEPAARLTQKLLELTSGEAGPNYSRVFLADSGSVSVEVAIKMALQYARGTGHPERNRLLTWRSGYHGDTFAAMSVCDPDGGMHSMWKGVLAEQRFAPAPPVRGASEDARAAYLAEFEQLITDDIAAVVIEPVVQGAGGMRFHDAELVRGVRELCTKHGVLLLADEIATGFGRTGQLFTTLDNGVVPDILCVGKAITGGFMTLAAVLTTDKVAAGMEPSAIMHGPTFMGNPLACAVAAEATDIIAEGDWREQTRNIETWLTQALAPARNIAGVADVRVLGAIGVVEMAFDVDMAATMQAAVDQGVWIRPFGRNIYTMPPFVCTEDQVRQIGRAVVAAADAAAAAHKETQEQDQ